MTCYICKKPITEAIRLFCKAKTRREKDAFRDVCRECYTATMTSKGYTLEVNRWIRRLEDPLPIFGLLRREEKRP